jgi:hypothetical protein
MLKEQGTPGKDKDSTSILYSGITMTAETITKKVRYLVDRQGRRTHAVLPIKEFEEFLEDIQDLALGQSRLDDEDVPLKEAFKRLDSDE